MVISIANKVDVIRQILASISATAGTKLGSMRCERRMKLPAFKSYRDQVYAWEGRGSRYHLKRVSLKPL